jgi:hypothetical protein
MKEVIKHRKQERYKKTRSKDSQKMERIRKEPDHFQGLCVFRGQNFAILRNQLELPLHRPGLITFSLSVCRHRRENHLDAGDKIPLITFPG